MKIEYAKIEDLKKCLAISDTPELEISDGIKPTQKELAAGLESGIYLVAKENDQILGYALGYIHSRISGYLDLLVVSKKYRDSGIGSQLIDRFEKELRDKDIESMWLLANTNFDRTQNFYQKKGFEAGNTFKTYSKQFQE
jgi:ribosomal-protein-alanine N-acetyltransferase